jgi:hypothetical protein
MWNGKEVERRQIEWKRTDAVLEKGNRRELLGLLN